jgi:hypothetical protein
VYNVVLILREEHRLRVFENRVLRRIFEPKRDGVTGSWRKLQNEEPQNVYSSPNRIKMIVLMKMSLAGHLEGIVRRGMYMGY